MSGDSSVSIEDLRCNSCGAPLQVPRSANFVTCNHCRTQLAVRRETTASYTEALAQVSQQTEALTEQVKFLTYQNELSALDRQWETERKSYMIRDKHGHRHVPSEVASVIGGGAMGIMGLVFLGISASAGAGMPAFMGVFLLLGGVVAAIYGMSKARAYRSAYRRYQMRRAALSPDNVDVSRFVPALHADPGEVAASPESFLTDLEHRGM
jgi:LSD1 subclass zinc finger protein